MNRIFITIAAAAPLIGGCSKAEVDWSQVPVLEGAQAALAIDEWRSGLDSSRELEFPVTVHWEMKFNVKDMPQLLGKPADAFATLVVDSTLLGGNQYRSSLKLEIIAPSFDNYITLWMESDGEELRLHHRGLDSIDTISLPFELPAGLRLSAARQDMVVDFLKRIGSQLPGLSDDESRLLMAMNGLSELYHPDNMLHFLGSDLLQQNSRWQDSGDVALITVALMEAMEDAPNLDELRESGSLDFLSQLSDLELAVEFDRHSGAFKQMRSSFDYDFQGFPTRGETQPSMNVELHLELRNTEVGGLIFKERDKVLDLDDEFDSYWPTVVAAEPLMIQALHSFEDKLESEGDFSF